MPEILEPENLSPALHARVTATDEVRWRTKGVDNQSQPQTNGEWVLRTNIHCDFDIVLMVITIP